MKTTVLLDGRTYQLEVFQKSTAPADAPRLIVVSHLPNGTASRLLEVCIRSVERFTPEPHELWIVDNNSPRENVDWLTERTNLNVVLNRTEPLPPEARVSQSDETPHAKQQKWGSYANAIGLELGARLIDQSSRYLMTMHMDVAPCRSGWLSFLRSRIDSTIGAAGVRLDRTRNPQGVLHVLGYMVDFQLFKRLGLDFFPDLPELDVGDKVTTFLRSAGYGVFACRNTLWEQDLVEAIPESSPWKSLHVDRSLDDEGNVIFLHLGRGLRRSSGEHRKGTGVEDWLRILSAHLESNAAATA